jgi:predicted anti-sigma-YlaC factor YlaD
MLRVIGLVLLVVGIAGLAVGTFQYTRRKDVLNVGPVHVQASEKESFTVPPLAAGGVAALGLVLVLAAGRKN